LIPLNFPQRSDILRAEAWNTAEETMAARKKKRSTILDIILADRPRPVVRWTFGDIVVRPITEKSIVAGKRHYKLCL
jgi:hypothetical protein